MTRPDPTSIPIPTRTRCYALLEQAGTLPHIRQHCETVESVALEIAQRLAETGRKINLELISAAALLHDVTKTRSLNTGEDHAKTGAELIRNQGYAEVSEIIRQHVRLDYSPGREAITEAEIVNYADKRVIGHEIVDLEKRRAYIFNRYGKNYGKGELERIFDDTEKTEAKIFESMPYGPSRLMENLFQ